MSETALIFVFGLSGSTGSIQNSLLHCLSSIGNKITQFNLSKELECVLNTFENATDDTLPIHSELTRSHISSYAATYCIFNGSIQTIQKTLLASLRRYSKKTVYLTLVGEYFSDSDEFVLQDDLFSINKLHSILKSADVRLNETDDSFPLNLVISTDNPEWTQLRTEYKSSQILVEVLPNQTALLKLHNFPIYEKFAENVVDIITFLNNQNNQYLSASSENGGNLAIEYPTLYVPPCGSSQNIIFSVPGFTAMLNCGFDKQIVSWNFIRHFSILDSLIFTSFDKKNCRSAVLISQTIQNIKKPRLGHVFMDYRQDENNLNQSANSLAINVNIEKQKFIENLQNMKIPVEYVNDLEAPSVLYKRIGVGTLNLYGLGKAKSPNKNIVRPLVRSGNKQTSEITQTTVPIKDTSQRSILLRWLPHNPEMKVVTILMNSNLTESEIISHLNLINNKNIIYSGPLPEQIIQISPKVVTSMRRNTSLMKTNVQNIDRTKSIIPVENLNGKIFMKNKPTSIISKSIHGPSKPLVTKINTNYNSQKRESNVSVANKTSNKSIMNKNTGKQKKAKEMVITKNSDLMKKPQKILSNYQKVDTSASKILKNVNSKIKKNNETRQESYFEEKQIPYSIPHANGKKRDTEHELTNSSNKIEAVSLNTNGLLKDPKINENEDLEILASMNNCDLVYTENITNTDDLKLADEDNLPETYNYLIENAGYNCLNRDLNTSEGTNALTIECKYDVEKDEGNARENDIIKVEDCFKICEMEIRQNDSSEQEINQVINNAGILEEKIDEINLPESDKYLIEDGEDICLNNDLNVSDEANFLSTECKNDTGEGYDRENDIMTAEDCFKNYNMEIRQNDSNEQEINKTIDSTGILAQIIDEINLPESDKYLIEDGEDICLNNDLNVSDGTIFLSTDCKNDTGEGNDRENDIMKVEDCFSNNEMENDFSEQEINQVINNAGILEEKIDEINLPESDQNVVLSDYQQHELKESIQIELIENCRNISPVESEHYQFGDQSDKQEEINIEDNVCLDKITEKKSDLNETGANEMENSDLKESDSFYNDLPKNIDPLNSGLEEQTEKEDTNIQINNNENDLEIQQIENVEELTFQSNFGGKEQVDKTNFIEEPQLNEFDTEIVEDSSNLPSESDNKSYIPEIVEYQAQEQNNILLYETNYQNSQQLDVNSKIFVESEGILSEIVETIVNIEAVDIENDENTNSVESSNNNIKNNFPKVENCNFENNLFGKENDLTQDFLKYSRIEEKIHPNSEMIDLESILINEVINEDDVITNLKQPFGILLSNTLKTNKSIDAKSTKRDFTVTQPLRKPIKKDEFYYYLTVVFIPLDKTKECGNLTTKRFFNVVRARYYIFSSADGYDVKILNDLLAARRDWGDNMKDTEVTIVPTYDTKHLHDWILTNQDAMNLLKISIDPACQRCRVVVGENEDIFSAGKIVIS